MKCEKCKKIFYSREPEEYAVLFESGRRYYMHLTCFLEKYTSGNT
jgi:hypothetical protein